jgi:hypothetical protein
MFMTLVLVFWYWHGVGWDGVQTNILIFKQYLPKNAHSPALNHPFPGQKQSFKVQVIPLVQNFHLLQPLCVLSP